MQPLSFMRSPIEIPLPSWGVEPAVARNQAEPLWHLGLRLRFRLRVAKTQKRRGMLQFACCSALPFFFMLRHVKWNDLKWDQFQAVYMLQLARTFTVDHCIWGFGPRALGTGTTDPAHADPSSESWTNSMITGGSVSTEALGCTLRPVMRSQKSAGVMAEESKRSWRRWSRDRGAGATLPDAVPTGGDTPGSVRLCSWPSARTGVTLRGASVGPPKIAATFCGWAPIGTTAGPPSIGGRTAASTSWAWSWACRANASEGTIALSFLNKGDSQIKWTLASLLPTATAEILGPVSSSVSASTFTVQWAWIWASWESCRTWSGDSTRALRSLTHWVVLDMIVPGTRLTTSQDGGTEQVLHETSMRSPPLLKRNSSRSASSPKASTDDVATNLHSKWQRGYPKATTNPPWETA